MNICQFNFNSENIQCSSICCKPLNQKNFFIISNGKSQQNEKSKIFLIVDIKK